MSIKRMDRTVQMMRELQKETADALEAAALKLKTISQQSVSRRYVRRPGVRRTATQQDGQTQT
jgi:hypothetical protein